MARQNARKREMPQNIGNIRLILCLLTEAETVLCTQKP